MLAPDEILVEIVVPNPGAHSGGNYLRHTPRRELDIAVVGVASQLTLANGVCTKARIALAAVAPVPLRATAAEQALEGQAVTPDRIKRAADLAVDAARPISDQRGSAEFRSHLVRVLTRRTLTTALARASAVAQVRRRRLGQAGSELHGERRAGRGARPALGDAARKRSASGWV